MRDTDKELKEIDNHILKLKRPRLQSLRNHHVTRRTLRKIFD